MYDDNFTGLNSSDVENKEHDASSNAYSSNVSSYSESSVSSTLGNNVSSYNADSANSNLSSNDNSNYSSNYSRSAYNSSSNNTLYNNESNNNLSASSYNNRSNTDVNAYGSSNTANDSNAYSNNTAGSTYSSSNAVSNAYISNTTGNAYGYNSGTWNNQPYRQSGNSYQYSNTSNTYPNDYAVIKKEKKKKEKKKKEGTGSGYFKKVLVCVSLGLFFGVCAGLGFYAVEAATGMLNNQGAATPLIEEQADEVQGNNVVSESVTYDLNGGDIQKTQTITTVVSNVSDVVKAVMPSVVSINNTYTERMSYFGQTLTNEAQASGSGIIVGKSDTELLIATNYHVIEDADKLTVQFVEDSEVEASVKGTDPDMDLAVIAVSLDSIQKSTLDQIAVATLGDSDELEVGEPAIAIGNSLGYGQSVTTGVISALNRDMELSDGSTGTFIQTDAAINPGNSGGALLNINGEVIGINSNKIGGSVIEGMGYAIPISAASPILAELMLKETKNKVAEDERGFLGISGISVTAEVSSAYGMPEGVYIAQVYDGTAAAAAGLVKGDIITEFDGESISSMEELQTLLEYYAKGDTVEMTVMKVGSGGYLSTTVTITLGNKVG